MQFDWVEKKKYGVVAHLGEHLFEVKSLVFFLFKQKMEQQGFSVQSEEREDEEENSEWVIYCKKEDYCLEFSYDDNGEEVDESILTDLNALVNVNPTLVCFFPQKNKCSFDDYHFSLSELKSDEDVQEEILVLLEKKLEPLLVSPETEENA